MVKAEFKVPGSKSFPVDGETKPRVQLPVTEIEIEEEAGENCGKNNESKQTKIEDGEIVVVENNTERSHRRPKTCAFISFFVLVLVVGFLIVYLISRKSLLKSDDVRLLCESMDPRAANVSEQWKDLSWETREKLFQLTDSVGSEDKILGLTPIYRKDLPKNYIAYWEIKILGKKGENYVIISAGKQTGDHRLAEEGALPSPTDQLRDKAKGRGYKCHKFFRISPDGVMVCEDGTVHHIVASTTDWENSVWDNKWTTLDYQVSRELPRFKKEWEALARRVRKLPEWNRFKWLNRATDRQPTRRPTLGSASPTIVLFDLSEELRGFDGLDYEFGKLSLNYDNIEADFGLRPGQSVRIPIGHEFRGVRVKFTGFGHRRWKKRRGWAKRWQNRVCRVLCNLCEEDEFGENTRVKSRFLKRTKMGDRYLHVRIHSSDRFVRRQLHGQEIRFSVELKVGKSTFIVIHYGIILKARHRGPRAVRLNEYSIPHQEWVPDYVQHKHGECLIGSGPVAWATLFGYYDNLAHKAPQLGYRKAHFSLFDDKQSAPLLSSPKVKVVIEEIHKSLKTHCVHPGLGLTQPTKMNRIQTWYRARFGANLNLIVRVGPVDRKNTTSTPTAIATKLLKEGIPVIVTREGIASDMQNFALATALRQRSNSYRLCDGADCSGWASVTESEIFVRESFNKNSGRWETADTSFAAAVLKPGS